VPPFAVSALNRSQPTGFTSVSECRGPAPGLHDRIGIAQPKCIVYVLKSETLPARYYTGLTSHLAARLEAHNAGRCPHAASGKPWKIDTAEEIAQQYSSISLADVKSVITYYLRHKTEVSAYLHRRQEEAATVREEVERRFPPSDIRERLIARRR
jgi:hypothetical protein